MPEQHIDSYTKFIHMVETAHALSAGPTLKGNAIQVRVRFTDVDGKGSIGYISIPSSGDIKKFKLDYHRLRKIFRFSCGSGTRNAIENWIRINPPYLTQLQSGIITLAKESLESSNVMERKANAVQEKCRKALREWGVHAFKNGLTREEVSQILDECVVKATMDD